MLTRVTFRVATYDGARLLLAKYKKAGDRQFFLKERKSDAVIMVSNPNKHLAFDGISVDCQLDFLCHIDGWLRMGLLPPPRKLCRHILSCRELKAESFKRCLHSVLRGVSL